MSRLTARTENGNAYLANVKPDEQEVDSPHKNTLQCILDCFERLAQYEDAEEQGLLVRLPCKVGDTVYYPFAGRVIEKRVSKYTEILRKSECVDKWYCVEFSDDETFDEEDVGKTVFLTCAEAEEALKGGMK
jgi:hypothetical protein